MMRCMADLERRSSSPLSRRQREKRAYQLTLATGGLAVVGVVGLVLALFTGFGAGLPIVALVLAAVCFVLLRRTLGVR